MPLKPMELTIAWRQREESETQCRDHVAAISPTSPDRSVDFVDLSAEATVSTAMAGTP